MIYDTLKALMVSILAIMAFGCTKTQVIQPAPKLPCPTCPIVEIRQCYEDTMGVVVFFKAEKEDGSIEVIPAPLIEPGCRCTLILDDQFQFVSTFPVSPEFCAEHSGGVDEEEPEAETQVHER